MISLTYNTATGAVALAQPAIIKPGNSVPVVLTFSAAPGTVNGLQLALVDNSTPRVLQAFLDVSGWNAESSTVFTGALDVSGALVTYMAERAATSLNLQLTVQLDGVKIDLPDLSLTVQPQGIPTDPSSTPGPIFYTATQSDGRYALLTVAGQYRIQSDGSFQLWNAAQSKWHTLAINGAAGVEVLTIGAGES
ncbi:MAG: hypothetical protein P4L00_09410 [Candidatus Acidoferrales bacterium]|nr:hypothetical protein [Candidatus Acidoferrales bacterium]